MDLSLPQVYEWNRAQWRKLAAQFAQLPHALLLTGPAGLGKNAFATRIAAALLCERPTVDADPCGTCKGCTLFAAGTHPDLRRVAPHEAGKGILIDQIRALADFLALKPHSARHKVVIVSPAEAMNVFSANSLLKILEEPPLGSYLILVSAQPTWLPPTVRSRCAHIHFHPPETGQGQAWLAAQSIPADQASLLLSLADNAPLQALAAYQDGFLERRASLLADVKELAAGRGDPVACAARWKKLGAGPALAWFQRFVADLARVSTTAGGSRLSNPDLSVELQGRAKALNLVQVLDFFRLVSQNHSMVGESLDELLLLEETLIGWVRLNR